MDLIAQKANQSRSKRGSSFERKLLLLFTDLKAKKLINNFESKPKIFGREFNPDFVIRQNNGCLISLDATTTPRTDRLRAKQWDAYGTKLFYKEKNGKDCKILAYVVVQEHDKNKRERANFRLCQNKCKTPHSALDDAVSVKELVKILTK